MTIPRLRRRDGVTLVELLVAMTVTTIVGAALIQVMLAQNRSSGNNEAWRVARSVSRGSLNRLLADVRAVNADSALEAATSQSITLRVPYAIGVACNITLPMVVSLLPIDNAAYSAAFFAGWAWRDVSSGKYRYRANSATVNTAAPGTCIGANIATLPASAGAGTAGRVVQLNAPSLGNSGGYSSLVPSIGMNVFLFQRVRYRFAPSVALPGRIALWRDVLNGGPTEELAAPFDTTARFRFYTVGNDSAQNAVPSPLNLARGIEIHLDGMSEVAPQGFTDPKRMALTTSIFFKNEHD